MLYRFKCYQRKPNGDIYGLKELEADGPHNAACAYGEQICGDDLSGIEVYTERVEGGAHYRFNVYLEVVTEVRARLLTWHSDEIATNFTTKEKESEKTWKY